jgi:hypothetical protein
MLPHLLEIADGNALRPHYDARSLAWLLEQTARKTRHGRLRARAVHEGARLIGWYLYYARAGEVGEVLQVAAHDGSFGRVLQRLLADAYRQGATAVRGRLDPRHVQELSDRHCWFRREGHGRWCIRDTRTSPRPFTGKRLPSAARGRMVAALPGADETNATSSDRRLASSVARSIAQNPMDPPSSRPAT